jgi:hypothetical protein
LLFNILAKTLSNEALLRLRFYPLKSLL